MMRSKSGFTFIEVILVVVIAGILLAVALPRFNFGRNLARTTAKKITNDLRVTRSKAINEGAMYYLQLSPSSPYTEYGIYDSSDNLVGETQVIPPEVTCTASTDVFQFNYLGACNSGVDGTITCVAEGQTHTITITGFTGRAYVP